MRAKYRIVVSVTPCDESIMKIQVHIECVDEYSFIIQSLDFTDVRTVYVDVELLGL